MSDCGNWRLLRSLLAPEIAGGEGVPEVRRRQEADAVLGALRSVASVHESLVGRNREAARRRRRSTAAIMLPSLYAAK